jgi:glutathione S-transferase
MLRNRQEEPAMKLYFAPYTCALAPHIVALEAGIALELERVDLRTHRTAAGDDYRAVSALGYVPALRLDDGNVLIEGVAIIQYLADLVPNAKLAPPPATFARVRLQEWLNFIATELHKTFSPWLFHPEVGEAAQRYAKERLRDRFARLDGHLRISEYLLGGGFTVADAYCFTIVGWSRAARIGLEDYPALASYMARIAARRAVRDAIQLQGTSKAA